MARLTAQERKTLAELSQRAQDEDDKNEGLELWVETKAGHKVKLTGAKASAFARKHDLDLDEDDDQDDDVEDDQEPDDKKKAGGYFVGKKKSS